MIQAELVVNYLHFGYRCGVIINHDDMEVESVYRSESDGPIHLKGKAISLYRIGNQGTDWKADAAALKEMAIKHNLQLSSIYCETILENDPAGFFFSKLYMFCDNYAGYDVT